MKSERARTALISHASLFINQINAIGPARVSLFRSVVETIDERGKFDAKLAHAHARHLFALSYVLWTGEDDLIANVALHLPNIAGMRFEDIDGVKLDLLPVIFVELV